MTKGTVQEQIMDELIQHQIDPYRPIFDLIIYLAD